mmetsp:Transcript_19175/g.76847  ORF Transcript_19175/g.76847 Transcript_19175/m.76847 type:complete len:115 (+) Transcript_19175:1453-1797(+)
MKGDVVKKNLKMYRPPCEDFQLEQVDLKKGESVKLDPANGPSMLVTISGDGIVAMSQKKNSASMPLYPGTIYYCQPKNVFHVTCTSESPLIVYRSNVNEKLIMESRSGSICTIH